MHHCAVQYVAAHKSMLHLTIVQNLTKYSFRRSEYSFRRSEYIFRRNIVSKVPNIFFDEATKYSFKNFVASTKVHFVLRFHPKNSLRFHHEVLATLAVPSDILV